MYYSICQDALWWNVFYSYNTGAEHRTAPPTRPGRRSSAPASCCATCLHPLQTSLRRLARVWRLVWAMPSIEELPKTVPHDLRLAAQPSADSLTLSPSWTPATSETDAELPGRPLPSAATAKVVGLYCALQEMDEEVLGLSWREPWAQRVRNAERALSELPEPALLPQALPHDCLWLLRVTVPDPPLSPRSSHNY